MDTVSFETAKRLHESGFPPQSLYQGQPWYTNDGVFFYFLYALNHEGKPQKDCSYPALTASDILRQLPSFVLMFDNTQFLCGYNGLQSTDCSSHINAAECCALAWFSRYKTVFNLHSDPQGL